MIRHYLPRFLSRELFGFRDIYGSSPDPTDKDWMFWTENYSEIYKHTQRTGKIGSAINDAGYKVLDGIDLTGLRVCEIGPGWGYVFNRFKGTPKSYCAIDVSSDFFPALEEKCKEKGISDTQMIKVLPNQLPLPLAAGSFDIVLSFYSLEHVMPLEKWTTEIHRLLDEKGHLVGAIPTEGGFLWGLGRWLTSRRWLKRKYGLDIRKLICWEHPNSCDEIVNELNLKFESRFQSWPMSFLPNDCNFVIKFVSQKP